MPQSSQRGTSPRWAKPRNFLFALGIVLIASAVSLLSLHNYSSNQYEQAMETGQLGVVVYNLNASAWRATQAQQKPRQFKNATELAEIDDSMGFLTATVERSEKEIGEGHDVTVRPNVIEFATVIKRVYALLQQGRGAEAMPLMIDVTDSTFYGLTAAISKASLTYAARAHNARRVSTVAAILVYAVTTLVIGFMYWRYRAVRQQVEQAAAEQEVLRRSEARFRPLVQSSADVITVLNPGNVVLYTSPASKKLFGRDPEDVIGRDIMGFIPEDERPVFQAFLAGIAARPNFSASAEFDRATAFGVKCLEIVCTNKLSDPDVGGLVLNVRDITERKTLEDQLRHQAFHDSLTGLANGTLFRERLDRAMLRARESRRERVSVIYLDLDYFKSVNDELGHQAGDELLREVATRLNASVRATDTAARLGGDEFAVLLEDSNGKSQARNVADRIVKDMARPFKVGGREVHVSASIGVVVADPDTMSAEDLLRNADLTMYDAKQNGRDRVQYFARGMRLSIVERLRLTADLNNAIEQGEIIVYYQPTLDLEKERIMGFEALARWDHPEKGLLLPAEFIPIAEDTGSIQALGRLILVQACRQAKEWQDKFPTMRDITMSVNVSARQIQRPGIVEIVEHALSASGLDAGSLVLEITESVLLTQPERVIDTLNQIKTLGVRIALDDFGTGYSSLSYLKRFPIDVLKIDKSFIDGLELGDRDSMLVQTVIDLGHVLDLDIVAEGIERPEQLLKLRSLNCGQGQGYLFSKPLDAAAAERFLEQQTDARAEAPDDTPAPGRVAA